MNKNAIKKFAIDARKKLIASVSDRAGMLGITPEECSEPISKGIDFEVYKTIAGTEITLNRTQCEQRRKLKEQIEVRGFEAVVEEVAYTWFNRICAIRFMEVNDYLPTRVRVLSSEKQGKNEPDIVTQAPDVDLDFTDKEKEYILDCKINSKLDELFQRLFIKQCNKLSEILPELFEATEDYTEMLLNISYTNKDDVISMLVNSDTGIPEADFNINTIGDNGEKTGQVEIIGWLYQYYISEKHEQIISINSSTVKKEDIPAATQLFTTDWVVRYMVDNSLGKYWVERNSSSTIIDKLTYLVKKEIKKIDEKISPTDITFIDPCMGSGHILVYAFDVLMEIYRECGYSDKEAAQSIVQRNIYGVDIDKRAYQLAYFAIMMKARSYDRRFFTRNIKCNLAEIEESNGINCFSCEGITANKEMNEIGEYLVDAFCNAKEIGSLQKIEQYDYERFDLYLDTCVVNGQLDMFSSEWLTKTLPLMHKLVKQAQILSEKYTVVCTNPPYMGKLEGNLKRYVVDNYKDYSGDLFSVFIYRNFGFCVDAGYSAFMTPFVWMFIKTYEKLRNYIIHHKMITDLVQMEYSAFEEATVPICAFVLKNSIPDGKGLYIKLSNFKGGMEVQRKKVLEAIDNRKCGYFFETDQREFSRISGNPIAFWASKEVIEDFEHETKVETISETRIGMATANNDLFMRFWHEVDVEKIGFGYSSREDAKASAKKWFPYCKGGSYRKWYGNLEYVVNWENDGWEIQNFRDEKTGRVRSHNYNLDHIFKPGLTFTAISSSNFACRTMENSLFGSGGSGICNVTEELRLPLLGLLNSKIVEYLLSCLSPTMNFEVNTVGSLPFIIKDNIDEITRLVSSAVELAKSEWNSYETAWEFKKFPLINGKTTISAAYEIWENECKSRFERLKDIEKQINQILIETYSLETEMTSDIEDEDITIRKADKERDIKRLISYAVGCMLGRFSLDFAGISYAGGEWDSSRFSTFMPDADGIIPINDEEYFSDDIVGYFVEWLKAVYGESTLEQNLDYIADVLGNKANTSRETIRLYFVNDFMNDHIKMYQKRPIYWLFDSGKANGFKALVYLHRYKQETVGKVRIEYLHRTQKAIEQALSSVDYAKEHGNTSEKARATKMITKYTKQLGELRNYDEAMAHIANQRINIDLDDGIKVNYEKFQGVEVAQEGKKALKIDLLAKIK